MLAAGCPLNKGNCRLHQCQEPRLAPTGELLTDTKRVFCSQNDLCGITKWVSPKTNFKFHQSVFFWLLTGAQPDAVDCDCCHPPADYGNNNIKLRGMKNKQTILFYSYMIACS